MYFLRNKSDVYKTFVSFDKMAQTQFQTQIRILRSDNGTEYKNIDMNLFNDTNGLIHQTTCRDTPQQNGVAERKNRTLLEMTHDIMI